MDCELLYKILAIFVFIALFAYLFFVAWFYATCATPPTEEEFLDKDV